jgi:hypothetical protein
MGKLVRMEDYRPEAQQERWARQDRELERYCLGPWLRYGGNLGDGGHRAYYPTMDEQEQGWGRDQ